MFWTREEIRKALEKATPSPWKVDVGEQWSESYPRNTYVQAVWDNPPDEYKGALGYRVAAISGVGNRTMSDACLIANAPTWLHQLLEENKQLSDELHWWQLERDKTNTKINTAIEALEFYGDHDNYTHDYISPPDVFADGGEKARQTLSQLKG